MTKIDIFGLFKATIGVGNSNNPLRHSLEGRDRHSGPTAPSTAALIAPFTSISLTCSISG